ncbi:hypothetical protein DB29_02641 [Shouchella clausii]|nr:hypothetical protein DB29_02641 [Shouchella clausii]
MGVGAPILLIWFFGLAFCMTSRYRKRTSIHVDVNWRSYKKCAEQKATFRSPEANFNPSTHIECDVAI